MRTRDRSSGKGKATRGRWLALAAALLALFASLPAGAQTPAEVIEKVRFVQRINQTLPLELTFRDETGRAAPLGDYFGRRPVVLALVYYECPMLCTYVLNGLVQTLRPLTFEPGNQFDVVVVSFNPKETPALAAAKKEIYLKEYNRPRTARGWHFLTGDEESIRRLTEAVGFRYLYNPADGQYAHASGLVVVTPEGRLFRYFYGISFAPRDLRLALVEASANKLGTVIDQVMLFCFHYDPQTGKYGLVIWRVMQVAGMGTALALAAFLVVMFRRERRGRFAALPAPGSEATKA